MLMVGVAVRIAAAVGVALGEAAGGGAAAVGVAAGHAGVLCNIDARRLPGSSPALPVSGIVTRAGAAATTGCATGAAWLAAAGVFVGQGAAWAYTTDPPCGADVSNAAITANTAAPAAASIEIASASLMNLPLAECSSVRCRLGYVCAGSMDLLLLEDIVDNAGKSNADLLMRR
jgi:hypothetical protein